MTDAPATTRRPAPTSSTTSTSVVRPPGSYEPCPADVGDHVEQATMLPTRVPPGFTLTAAFTSVYTPLQWEQGSSIASATTSTTAPGTPAPEPIVRVALVEEVDGRIGAMIRLEHGVEPFGLDSLAEGAPVERNVRGTDFIAGTYVNRGASAGFRRATWVEDGRAWLAHSSADLRTFADILDGLRIVGTDVTDPTGRSVVFARNEIAGAGPFRTNTLELRADAVDGTAVDPTVGWIRVTTENPSIGPSAIDGGFPFSGPDSLFSRIDGRWVAADVGRAVTVLDNGSVVSATSSSAPVPATDLAQLVTSLRTVDPDDAELAAVSMQPTIVMDGLVCRAAPTNG